MLDEPPISNAKESSHDAAAAEPTSSSVPDETPDHTHTHTRTANTPARKRTNRSGTTQPTDSPRPSFNLIRVATSMLQHEKPLAPAPGFLQSLKSIICASYLNILLVFIPISWALHFALPHSFSNRDTLIFVFSFLAIIPLAKLLGFATEELSLRVGQTLAGLLNATLGNAVELIVAIIALVKCELRIVQSSLVGSILSNLLLVLGMCFFAGGMRYSEQGFGISASQLNSSLLTISVIAVLLPAAFHLSVSNGDQAARDEEGSDILSVSHGVAIILLFIYGAYLFFQLYSHTVLYEDKGEHVIQSTRYVPRHKKKDGKHDKTEEDVVCSTTTGQTSRSSSQTGHIDTEAQKGKKESEEEKPQMSLWMSIILLAIVTVLVAVTAEFLVTSIDGLTETGHISKEFVGLILLPIVGNAAEHATAVTVSVKDKLTLSLGVAVGSSIQIALFVIPLVVTLGWILGKPLTLLFDPYESITLFLAVLTVNYVVQDGKSNWLEGILLMSLYIILGVTFWFYPGSDPSGLLAQCKP